MLLAHIFLDSQPNPKLAEEYFNIVWAHVFPQVLKVNKHGAADFDMGSAWSKNGGTVMVGVEANITKLAESAASFGFINIKPDQDGTLRHALLMIRYQDQDFFPSLDLEVVREYEKIRDQDIAAYIATRRPRVHPVWTAHTAARARWQRPDQLHRPLSHVSALFHVGCDFRRSAS